MATTTASHPIRLFGVETRPSATPWSPKRPGTTTVSRWEDRFSEVPSRSTARVPPGPPARAAPGPPRGSLPVRPPGPLPVHRAGREQRRRRGRCRAAGRGACWRLRPSVAEASIDQQRADVPGFEEFLVRWSAAHGQHDPRASRFVLGWLSLVHPLARPLARRRVPPTRITVVGGLCGVAVAGVAALGGYWVLLAVALVLLVAVLDALDGAVAVLTDTATAWGRVVDPLTDRLGDLAFVVALGLLGAPWALCAVAGALALLQESVRATATAAGMDGLGVVTVSERPTRVIVAVVSLVAAGAVPSDAAFSATAGVLVGIALGATGIVQLLVVVRRRLRPAAVSRGSPPT